MSCFCEATVWALQLLGFKFFLVKLWTKIGMNQCSSESICTLDQFPLGSTPLCGETNLRICTLNLLFEQITVTCNQKSCYLNRYVALFFEPCYLSRLHIQVTRLMTAFTTLVFVCVTNFKHTMTYTLSLFIWTDEINMWFTKCCRFLWASKRVCIGWLIQFIVLSCSFNLWIYWCWTICPCLASTKLTYTL